jgi:hypothetical protein
MRRHHLAAVLGVVSVLLRGAAILAQTLDPSSITKQLICDGPKACNGGYINGHIYETMTADSKIGILVSLAVAGKYVRADIFVITTAKTT